MKSLPFRATNFPYEGGECPPFAMQMMDLALAAFIPNPQKSAHE